MKAIEWCGVCWLSNRRFLAEHKVRKFPLCVDCFTTFGHNIFAIRRLYEVWLEMPDMDERADSRRIFRIVLGARQVNQRREDQIVGLVEKYLEKARDCERGGKADSYLRDLLCEIKTGSPMPIKTEEQEQEEWLRKGRKTLREIRRLVRNPQELQQAASTQVRTSQT